MTNSKSNWSKTQPTTLLRFPNKQLRARAIARHVRNAGITGLVVFTCGNAAAALRAEAVRGFYEKSLVFEVLEVGPKGLFNTDKWWTPAEIHKMWPHFFDATSGHLPFPLMLEIAKDYKEFFTLHGMQDEDGCNQFFVPTGSGETIICLQMAFPDKLFAAVYDNSNPATTRDKDAPLNDVVDAFFLTEYWHGSLAI